MIVCEHHQGVEPLDDIKIIKKKQLLAQRDEILAAIGSDLYENGSLPPQFESLRHDFQNMEILVTQLKDRFRALQEERDKVRQEEHEIAGKLAKIERCWEKELMVPMRDHEELLLKVRYLGERISQRDQKQQDELEDLKRDAERARKVVAQLRARKGKAVAAINQDLKPARLRLQKLEAGMGQVRKEAEHLSIDRQKRLRDLAHHYYKNGLEKDKFGARYALLEHICAELADNRKKPHPENFAITRKEENKIGWHWLIWLVLAIAFIGFHFRVVFHSQPDTLASVTRGLEAEGDAGLTLFADLNYIERRRLDADWPGLTTLPGGALLFKDIARDEVQQVAISRDVNGELLFCGLKTRRSIGNFGQKLARQGWHKLATTRNWQALTNEEMIWLALGSREYLLLPRTALDRFEALEIESTSHLYWLKEQIKAFDNNRPLLQGFDQISLTLEQERFLVELSSRNPLTGNERRREYLDLLTERQESEEFTFRYQNNRFLIRGPADFLTAERLTGNMLKSFVEQVMDRLIQIPLISDVELEMDDPGASGQYVTIMTTAGPEQLQFAGSFATGGSISDLAWSERDQTLLVTDSRARSLRKWQLDGKTLRSSGQLRFGSNPNQRRDAPFNPGPMVLRPDDQWVVLLERTPFSPNKPRIAVVEPEAMTIRWMIDLPREVRNSLSGAWDAGGETLVLGCSARRMRGKSSLAVLVYHFHGGEPRLFQLIDLPHGDLAPPMVPSLVWEQTRNQLFLFQAPRQHLVRYALDRTSDSILEQMPFGAGAGTSLPRGLVLNRTGAMAVLAGGGPSRSLLHLVRFEPESMTLVDRLNPGFEPASITRIPMTDRFWVTGTREGVVAVISIREEKLVLESRKKLPDLKPGLMAADSWGSLLFLATEYEPSPIYE